MKFDTNQLISMSEANQNFSKVVKIVDNFGKAVIQKNNKPKYLIIDISNDEYIELSEEEKVKIIAERVLNKHIKAFKELAK